VSWLKSADHRGLPWFGVLVRLGIGPFDDSGEASACCGHTGAGNALRHGWQRVLAGCHGARVSLSFAVCRMTIG
jgi:hypothetical protein